MIQEYGNNLEEETQKAIHKVYGAEDPSDVGDVDWNDPFFSSMKLEYNPLTGDKLAEAQTVADMTHG